MLKRKCLLFLVFLLCTYVAYATTADSHDTVLFKNGDTLTGTIVSANSVHVIFSNSAVGNLTLSWPDLQALHIHHEVLIGYGEGPTPRSFTNPEITVDVSSTAGHLNLAIKPNNKKVVALKDIQSIAPDTRPIETTPANPGWIPTLSGSAAFIVSTQREQTYGAGLTLVRNWYLGNSGWPHQRTFIDLAAKYDDKRKNSSPGSATITDYYIGTFQHLFFLTSDRFYVSTTSDFVRNNSLGLFFQQSYGAGVGTFINRLELDADLRFLGEHFYGPNPSATLAASELSEQYQFDLNFKKKDEANKKVATNDNGVKLSQRLIFVPVFNASRAWQARGIVDLTVPINAKFAIVPKLEDYYVENAPSPFRKNYLNLSINLKVTPAAKH